MEIQFYMQTEESTLISCRYERESLLNNACGEQRIMGRAFEQMDLPLRTVEDA